MTALKEKLDCLRSCLSKMGRVAVAFSGGVDSTLLTIVAAEVLDKDCLAVTCRGPLFPEFELQQAQEICNKFGITHHTLEFNPLDDDDFCSNPPERCYICKKSMLKKLQHFAEQNSCKQIIEGTIVDDADDFRPGAKALQQAGIASPLADCGIGKTDVRQALKDLGLDAHKNASVACYASRIPYRTLITENLIRQVASAENFLRSLGYDAVRVRHHSAVARIEIPADKMQKFISKHAETVNEKLLQIGFQYSALDLAGLRNGSMNKLLDDKEIK